MFYCKFAYNSTVLARVSAACPVGDIFVNDKEAPAIFVVPLSGFVIPEYLVAFHKVAAY